MSEKKIYFIYISNFLLTGFTYFPHVLLMDPEEGIIWAVIIGMLIASFNVLLYVKTFNKFEDKSLYDISTEIFGKVIGKVITLSFSMVSASNGFFIFCAVVIISQKLIMPTTPNYIIGFFILIVLIMVFNNSERTMLNNIGYLTPLILIGYLSYTLMAWKEVDMRFVRGTFYHSLTSLPNFRKIIVSTFYFSGIEALAVYNPMLPKVSMKKTCLLFIFIGLPLAFITLAIPIGMWGPVAVKEINLPAVISSDAVAIELFVAERVLFIFFPIVFCAGLKGFCDFMYLSFAAAKKVIRNKAKLSGIYASCSLLFLYLVRNMQDIEKLIDTALKYGWIWIIYQSGLGVLLFVFSRRRK